VKSGCVLRSTSRRFGCARWAIRGGEIKEDSNVGSLKKMRMTNRSSEKNLMVCVLYKNKALQVGIVEH